MTIEQKYQQAVKQVQSGQLADAEANLNRILQEMPGLPDAQQLLAVIAHRTGRHQAAIDLLAAAIASNPNQAAYHCNLGVVLAESGRVPEAITSYQKAIELRRDHVMSHNNLGNAFKSLGEYSKAIASYQLALEFQPTNADAQGNLANALRESGRLDEAIVAYRKSLQMRPTDPTAFYNLATALRAGGQLDEAISLFRKTLITKPDYAEAWNNLGNALRDQSDLRQAVDAYRRAVLLKPSLAEAGMNLAQTLYLAGQYASAVTVFQQLHSQNPDNGEILQGLGQALAGADRLDEAVEVCRRAVRQSPESARALAALGHVLELRGEAEASFAAYRRVLLNDPDILIAHDSLVYLSHFQPMFDPARIYREHVDWSAQHAEPLADSILPHQNDRDPGRRLRIGCVSPDFREHPVMYFLEDLLLSQNPEQLEMVCYSELAPSNEDTVTARLRRAAAEWRVTLGMSNAALAEQIRADRIDILVDLAGHTQGNRLAVFARKPAPVQMTYLGYFDTTGLNAIDYRLTDPHADPVGLTEAFHSEKLMRLPRTLACYKPPADAPAVSPLPANSVGHVTFGSFTRLIKVSPPLVEAWAKILQSLPSARLFVTAAGLGQPSISSKILETFAGLGVNSSRITLHDRLPWARYWELHREIDIFLDTFPVHGHTTTCHALWMGVVPVSLAGKIHCQRLGASVLNNVGLERLVAKSVEEYIDISVGLAGNLHQLSDLRMGMRQRMQQSPLMQPAQLAREVHHIYRDLWKKWCLSTASAGTTGG